ncbi:MAG: phosphoenolpyruvate carboxykinase (GTP) [Alphaproteobacteria bacterium]|nr:phosphoenolpyruvate carboxykinase (GTP) [Alphaproteobacteria bacterium]
MLELKKGIDILSASGGISSIGDARALLADRLAPSELEKLSRIRTEEALLKIANAVAMCEPDSVFVDSGTDADAAFIRSKAVELGEEAPLSLDGHTIHFDLAEEQGRIVDRTFYIVNPGEKTSVMAKTKLRDEASAYVAEHMKGIMRGKTMFVGFFSRGPVGAVASTPAIEISSSSYVFHSADLLYRNAFDRFDAEVDRRGLFYTNVHSEGPWRAEDLPKARVFMDRAWQTTYSMYCTYAGNTLLLKKGNHRFSVDYATYRRPGVELSEHMFITGMKGPHGRVTYFVGAAPSGCGKTTTAMAGTDFIGDDLAQIWIADDGTVRAVNPEAGIFGIVQDVNRDGDPFLMQVLREPGEEVIFSNVLVHDGVPYWEGSGEVVPDDGKNFQGDWFTGKKDKNGKSVPMNHPNARATVRCTAIGNYRHDEAENPAGVPIRVVTYSGRDADTMPSVWVAKNPDHGVAIGASIVSKATATEIGVGQAVRRQPWANEPFIPGPLADYMRSQFAFFNSNAIGDDQRPIMAGLNYFLTWESRGGGGDGLLGEKRDVKVWLSWLDRVAHDEVETLDSPIGRLPKYGDLKRLFAELIDKEYPREVYDKQFSLYVDNILARLDMQEEAYRKEDNLPQALLSVYAEQRAGLQALKARFGAVVTPDELASA